MEEQAEEQKNNEQTQGYIDKIYNALIETGKTINRVLIILEFFSFAIIALSIGIVSISQDVTIFGIKLTFPSWLTLIGGSVIIATLYVYILTLSKVNRYLQNLIQKFYAKTQIRWSIVSPNYIAVTQYAFLLPLLEEGLANKEDILGALGVKPPKVLIALSLFTRLKNAFNLFVISLTGILLFLFPISAQIAAGIKMLALFKGIWWVWFSFILLLVISLGYLITYIGDFIVRFYEFEPRDSNWIETY